LRFFVALDFPDNVLDALAELQRPLQSGVRWMPRAQLHLTLHFLGEIALELVKVALATVASPPFELTLAGVGQFSAADGGTILWAGVRENAALIQLHGTLATALATTGFRPETRPYSPHLTLARCRPAAPPSFIREWLTHHRELRYESIPVRHVTLYSSALQSDGPVYRAEQTVRLDGPL
jgi:2'-5' RNA ligase